MSSLNVGTLHTLLDMDTGPFDRKMQQMPNRARQVGDKMSAGLTLPLAAVGAVAVKLSLDFEQTFSRMQGLAGVSAEEVDGLKESVLGLAGETGKAPQELAEALYFIRSAGLSGKDALEALEYSAKGAAAGLGSTVAVADAVTSAMNAYAAEGLTAARATDALVASAEIGKVEASELAPQLGRLAGVAASLGIGFEDLAGTVAFLSRTSGDAALSATQMQGALAKLVSSGAKGAQTLDAIGLSMDELRRVADKDGVPAALELLRVKLEAAGMEFSDFAEDQQFLQAAVAVTGENFAAAQEAVDQARDSVGKTGEAFSTFAETAGFQNAQAFAKLQAALIGVGDTLVPLVANVAQFASTFLDAFQALPGPVQKGAIALGILLAAVGPVISIGSRMATVWGGLMKVLTAVAPNAMAAGGALSRLGPMLGVGGIIAGTVAIGMLAGSLTEAKADVDHLATSLAGLDSAARKDAQEYLRLVDSWGDLDGIIQDMASTNMEGAMRLLELAEGAGFSAERIDELNGIVQTEAEHQAQAAEDGEANAAAMEEGATAADLEAEAIDGLVDAIDVLLGKLNDVAASQDDFQSGLNDIDDVMKDATESGIDWNNALNDTSDGAIALRDHMRDIIETGAGVIQSMAEQGYSSEQMKAKQDELAAAFVEQATAAGLPAPVIDHYLGLLGQIPTDVNTNVAATDSASPVLAGIEEQIGWLTGRTHVVRVVAQVGNFVRDAARAAAARGNAAGGPAGTGPILDGPSGTDTIPAWLSEGEFVHNRAAVQHYGLDFMRDVNAMRFAQGGPVRLGSVSDAEWERLKALGWRGRAGDNMEALYPPASASWLNDAYYANMTPEQLWAVIEDNLGEMNASGPGGAEYADRLAPGPAHERRSALPSTATVWPMADDVRSTAQGMLTL